MAMKLCKQSKKRPESSALILAFFIFNALLKIYRRILLKHVHRGSKMLNRWFAGFVFKLWVETLCQIPIKVSALKGLQVYHSSWHVKSLKLVQLMTEPGCGWPQTAAVTTWESEPYKLNDNLQRLSNVNWCWSYLSSQYDRGDGPYTAALCKPFWYPNTGRFSLIQDKENT